MNLFDMLAGAQGGAGLDALGKQFGLSPQQTQSAVGALLPAFSQAFRQNTASAGGLGSFLQALASGQHAKYAQDATEAFTPAGMKDGNGILGHLFGSKELSRAVAAQASQATGIGQDILKQMLPALASMLMGSLFKQTNNQMAAGTFGASNPLGEIIEQMMRQQGGGRVAPQPQQSDNPLGDILGQILGGGQAQQRAPQGDGNNPLGDILGQILGDGQGQSPDPRTRMPQGGGDNPLGDILGQILRGGQPAPEDDYEEEVQQRSAPQRRQRQPQPEGNPLEDIFGKMFNPGGQAPQTHDYQRGMSDIFEQFRRGVDRHR